MELDQRLSENARDSDVIRDGLSLRTRIFLGVFPSRHELASAA